MRYRKLGGTNLDVSVIGFGASSLGNVFGDVSAEIPLRMCGWEMPFSADVQKY